MVAKVVKLAVVPAALGLASFRVYAMTEEKTDKQIAPRELSIYSAEAPALRCVEEEPGHLQTGLGLIRVGLQPYVRAVQNSCTSVEVGAVSLYQAAQDTYHFLRDPPPGFLPRVGVITVSGLAGLILARKGSRLKRIGVPLALTAAATAVCYPMRTVGVLKVTGKKVYAGSSLIASAFKSKPREEFIVPDASLEHASEEVGPVMEVVCQPDELPEKVPSEAASVTEDVAPVPDVYPAVGAVVEEIAPVPEASSAVGAVVEEVAPMPEVSPTTDPVTEVTPASQAMAITQAGLTPVPDLAPDYVIPSEVVLGVEIPPVDTVVEFAPQEETTPVTGDVALEVEISPTEKAPVAVTPTEDTTEVGLLPDDLEEVISVSGVSPTEDAPVLDTDPLSDVTLKEPTSEDHIAAEVKLDVAAEESSPVSDDPPAIKDSSAGTAEEDGTALTVEAIAVVEDFPSPDIAPEIAPPEDVVAEDFTLAEGSPTVDVTSDGVEDTENLLESAAPPTEAAPLIVEKATPAPIAIEETTHSLGVEETTSPSLASEETTPSSLVVDETTALSLDVEEAKPPEITTCSPAKERSQFVADPSLLDHGQAHPEDADLYSTRG